MYLSFALLVFAAGASASCVSNLECPESIKTELSHNLNKFFLGVWYEVYIWRDSMKSKQLTTDKCPSIEVMQASPEEIQAMKEECEGSSLAFDWDNVHLKIRLLSDPKDPGRLIATVPEEAKLVILQTCDTVTEFVVRQVSGFKDTAVIIIQDGAELLVRESPQQYQLDCLVHNIDVVQNDTRGYELCSRSQIRQKLKESMVSVLDSVI